MRKLAANVLRSFRGAMNSMSEVSQLDGTARYWALQK